MNEQNSLTGDFTPTRTESGESQQRYRRLVEAVTDYIFTVRVEDGCPVETVHGPNCVAVTGYTPEEFADNPMLWIAMVPEEDRRAVEQQAARILAGQEAWPIEHRIVRKDGSRRWILKTCVPNYDARGKLLSYDGVIRDVTDRKEVEFALRQLNETLEQRVAQQTEQFQLLAKAVANLGEGVLITDDSLEWPGPRILFVNEAMCRITGYGADELVGQSPRLLQGEGTDRETLNCLRRELKDGKSCLCQLLNYRKNGAAYDAEVFITPLVNSEGQRSNFVSIHRDISDRKRMEESLRASEAGLRAILNTAADAIINIDTRGIIRAVNPAVERMFGYTQDELIGQKVNLLMPSPYREEHDAYIARYLQTGQAKIIGIGREVIALRKDGSTLPIDLAVSEVTDLGLFTGVIRDLTDRRRLQRQVLDIAVQQQTRIGQDLHDGVGQELTAVNYMTQNLIASLPGGSHPAAQIAQKITEGLKTTQQRLREVVKGLMPVDVDAQGLRAALHDLAWRTNASRQVSCSFTCSHNVSVTDTSTATHLYRIAQEAVNNALKHSQADRVDLTLRAEPSCLILEVRDNGVGMHAAAGKPEGIGQSIMRYRASLIGARLEVASGSNGGTVVRCAIYNLDSFSCDPPD